MRPKCVLRDKVKKSFLARIPAIYTAVEKVTPHGAASTLAFTTETAPHPSRNEATRVHRLFERRSMEIKILKKNLAHPKGIALFSIIRDEMYFLPRFFAHYRQLGVDDFLIYDDRSVDGSTDFLVEQPDCTVLTGPYKFDNNFGINWLGRAKSLIEYSKEVLPDEFFGKRWALTVDADEFMLLPPEFKDLLEFTAFLERQKCLLATGPMVDLYPEKLSDIRGSDAREPFAIAPYFDCGPFYHRISNFPYIRKLPVGIRARLRQMLIGACPTIFSGEKPPITQLFKVPLLKHGQGIKRIGSHYVNVPPPSTDLVALAHFKLYPGIASKIATAVREKQYYTNYVEYRWLNAIFENLADRCLFCPATRKFEGSASLRRANLMH
jgi:Glycosyl transferase family 2